MNKIATYSLFLSLFIILLWGIYISYEYYSPPRIKEVYNIPRNGGDTLNIAYIGDSWAFLHPFHNCLIAKSLEDSLHIPVAVYSYGINGHTSKEIYEELYKDSELRFFMFERKYEYCFISVGINDTYKKMSISYYTKSIEGIISLLIANQIHPIILEIPDYDIQRAYQRQNFIKKPLRILSMFVSRTPIDCKQQFRDAFEKLAEKKYMSKDISILRYSSWNNNYTRDLSNLYRPDGMHLNNNGYQKIDSIIAQIIIECEKKKQ